MKRALLVAAVLLLATMAAQGETGIKTVVKSLETTYHVRHHGVFGLWMAKPFMVGAGVHGLKIATFEHLRLSPAQTATVRKNLDNALGNDWFPFVETWEKDGEWSVIYAHPADKGMKLLIVSLETDEVNVVQMEVSGKAQEEWVANPVKSAEKHG